VGFASINKKEKITLITWIKFQHVDLLHPMHEEGNYIHPKRRWKSGYWIS